MAVEVLARVHEPEGLHLEVRHGQRDEGSELSRHSTFDRNGASKHAED
jgi:hypothetical protein